MLFLVLLTYHYLFIFGFQDVSHRWYSGKDWLSLLRTGHVYALYTGAGYSLFISFSQILRYRNGQAYVSHADYLDQPKTENYNYDTAGVGGNRYATILLYMTDLGEHDGGETVFKYAWPLGTSEEEKKVPLMKTIQEIRESGDMGLLKEGSWEEEMTAYCRTRLAIRPRAGRAVLFYSQDPNGEEDKVCGSSFILYAPMGIF